MGKRGESLKKIRLDTRKGEKRREKGPGEPIGEKKTKLRRQIRQVLLRGKTDKELQKRIALALSAICIGVGLGEMSRLYGYQKALEEEAAAPAVQTEEETVRETAILQKTVSPKEEPTAETETQPEEAPYVPSPDRLNLAYYYPEDSDGEDIIDSYAGQVFKELTIRDSEWLADIYELADTRPADMAARLGRAPSSVIGKYDPKNEKHDPDDPSTWTVDNWKSIHVSFSDGDGRTSTSYSNVKEILAMASVYTYYTDLMDVDAFKAYATRLWEDSHSYSLSMGSLYYCDGCVDKTDEEIAQEAILAEEGAASVLAVREEGDGAEAAPSSGDSPASESSPASKSSPPSDGTENGRSGDGGGQAADVPSADTADGAGTGSGSDQQVTVIRRTKKKTEEAGQEGSAGTGTETGAGTETDTAGQESHPAGTAQEDVEQPTVIRRTKKDLETAESLEGAELASDTDAQTAAAFGETLGSGGQDDAAGADGAADSSESAGQSDEEGSTSTDSQRQESRRSACPGHVDLYIRVKLLGLEDKNGLLARDKIGNAVSKGLSDPWDGWTEENVAAVRAICDQDWFADYGLSISSISLSTPLSAAEIQDYMEQLPEDLSETRKEIVRFALSSVGHVPYYWGGKASHPGYEGNNFGMLVPSDDKGRILKGLDCSGWISWVYWSVTGKQLQGSSTSGLILCGEKISRSELKPGDIIVRTGANAHVVMFLSWSANGQMNVIHESSASVNNVTIKTMDAAWPYYRRLVD